MTFGHIAWIGRADLHVVLQGSLSALRLPHRREWMRNPHTLPFQDWNSDFVTQAELARLIVESIDRHGLRGLIYDAAGLEEVVIHGRVNMMSVAQEVMAALSKE